MSLHPTMAAALQPFAPASSEVHRIAALPGIEARELNTPEDFADSLAGDLELVPVEQDEFTNKLQRAGLVSPPLRRRTSDWDGSRAATDNAHRNEVNSTTTDAWGFRA